MHFMKEIKTKSKYNPSWLMFFIKGVQSALPIVLGYLPLGFAYGVLAREAGFNIMETVMMSVMVYAGSGQFIAISLFSSGATVATIISTVFLINLRHLLFSASFVPHLRRFKTPYLALVASEITDETFAVAINHYQKNEARLPYHLGLNLTSHLSWITASLMGGLAGDFIGNPARFGLDFALPAMFITLLVMQIKDKRSFLVGGIAAVLSVLINCTWHGNWNIILATVLAATIGVIIEPWMSRY